MWLVWYMCNDVLEMLDLALPESSQPNISLVTAPAASSSRGGDVAEYVFDINQPSLPTPFYCIPVTLSVFMALSFVFHSISSPNNSPLSLSVLPVLFFALLVLSTIYVSTKVSFSPDIILCG